MEAGILCLMNPRKNVALCNGMGPLFMKWMAQQSTKIYGLLLIFPKSGYDPGFSILYGTWVVPFHWASIKGDYI